MLVDSHCHLDFPEFRDDLPGVIARAVANGVTTLVTISTFVGQAASYRAIAEAHPEVLWTVGTHPNNAAVEPDIAADELVALSAHARCVAIGESGLDFHYDRAPRDVQERVFRTHIEAARRTGLPLVIHARDADDAMIDILRDESGRGRFDAVLHCFSSGRRLAEVGLELGFFLSFSGILTFKRSEDLRALAASAPRDRLLVETDAPFLAPVPFRGKQNEPAYTRHTAETLAETLGLSLAETAALTSANFFRLFSKAREAVLPAGTAA